MEFFSLGKSFSVLQKRYIGVLSTRLVGTPIEKYFVPFHVIARNNGKINQCQLGEELLIDKASMVRILDHLSAKGMIERIVNPLDRREYHLNVTKEGEKWVKMIREIIIETNEMFLAFLPESEREKFSENLIKMTNAAMHLPSAAVDEF